MASVVSSMTRAKPAGSPLGDTSQRPSTDHVRTVMFTDPDGNHIAFAQATDPALAR